MKTLILFFFFTTSILFAEQEVVIYLPTKPYLSKVGIILQNQTSSIPSPYIKKLYELLLSDFEKDGRSKVVDLSQSQKNEPPVDVKLTFRIEPKTFTATLYDVKKQVPFYEVSEPLTQDWSKDHAHIHLLADSLHKKLYSVAGIASTKILYAVKSPKANEWQSEIFLSNYDGGSPLSLTHDKSYSISPSFIPKEESFIYVSYKKGIPKIFLKSLSTDLDIPLISLKGNQFLPTINRQKNKIAFISDVSGQADLFIQSFDPHRGVYGKAKQIFTFKDAIVASPTFSPDGSKIAFVSDFERRPKIYILDLSSSSPQKNMVCITPTTKENASPCWSPDGTKIAFSAKCEETRQIWIYDVQQKTTQTLTKDQKNKDNPTWAPNSFHLAYSTEEPDAQIYIINLSQQNPVQITSGPGIKQFPSWGYLTSKEAL